MRKEYRFANQGLSPTRIVALTLNWYYILAISLDHCVQDTSMVDDLILLILPEYRLGVGEDC